MKSRPDTNTCERAATDGRIFNAAVRQGVQRTYASTWLDFVNAISFSLDTSSLHNGSNDIFLTQPSITRVKNQCTLLVADDKQQKRKRVENEIGHDCHDVYLHAHQRSAVNFIQTSTAYPRTSSHCGQEWTARAQMIS